MDEPKQARRSVKDEAHKQRSSRSGRATVDEPKWANEAEEDTKRTSRSETDAGCGCESSFFNKESSLNS